MSRTGYTRSLCGGSPARFPIYALTATVWNPGDILCQTAGEWARVTAATDYDKPIAIADCYKTASDATGYYTAIMPQAGDVFIYPLDTASTSVNVGTQIKPVNHNTIATTSGGTQKFAVAVSTQQIPTSGATLQSISYVEIIFKASGSLI